LASPEISHHSRGTAALVIAAYTGRLEIVRCLLEAGADTVNVDELGRTALMHACRGGHLNVVDSLLGLHSFRGIEWCICNQEAFNEDLTFCAEENE